MTRDRSSANFRIYCTGCGAHFENEFAPFCPKCNSMTDVEYHLDAVSFEDSPNPYLRFQDLLPVADVGLFPTDATFTRTVHAVNLGQRIGMSSLYLKDETTLPTGTTKDRMAAVALAYLYECGVRGFCASSTGNSSTAYARAISRLPGMTMYLFTAADFIDRLHVPSNDQVVNFVLRDATFVEAFDAARDFAREHGLISERGFFNLGRREGLKIAWLEAAEQVPHVIDWYFQAVSSAMGVYGVAKAAQQLLALGRINRLPRLACVQQETCAPMVSAWEAGSDQIRPDDIVERPYGIAKAILRGDPSAAYPPVRRLVVETGGTFVSVSERDIREARELIEEEEGISPCFSAAAALAGLISLRRRGQIPAEDVILVNLTGRDRSEVSDVTNIHWMSRKNGKWKLEDPNEQLFPPRSGPPPHPAGSQR